MSRIVYELDANGGFTVGDLDTGITCYAYLKNALVILVNSVDPAHLAEVKAQMAVMGSPTIRAIDAGDHLIAIEGSHRLAAAEQMGVTVKIEIIDEDGMIDLDTLDWDDNGWFDDRVIPARDFIERFTASPFPAGQQTAQIDIA
jgi:hypothetical protein